MAKKIDAKNRKFDVGQQKGPLEEVAAEGKCKFLLSPARYGSARGASQEGTSRR
jgi:hypothetical protein